MRPQTSPLPRGWYKVRECFVCVCGFRAALGASLGWHLRPGGPVALEGTCAGSYALEREYRNEETGAELVRTLSLTERRVVP